MQYMYNYKLQRNLYPVIHSHFTTSKMLEMEIENGSVSVDRLTGEPSNIPQLKGCFAQQIAPDEFERQKRELTQSAVSALRRSTDYLQWYQRCSTCNSSWYGGQFSSQCRECGGFAMIRPCAICDGHCSAKWSRDVHMSHSFKEGHWKGACRLPESEQQHYLLQKFVDNTEDSLSEAMEDLGKT